MIHLRFYLFFLSCLLSISLSSCHPRKGEGRMVSVSILPQKYLTERIAGDYVKVNVMIPAGMNPATCDLSTGQLKKLYDSEVCFTIGYLPFEITHLYPILEQHPEIRMVNHSEHLQLVSGGCGGHSHEGHDHAEGVDPHIWLSPVYAQRMANTICEVLSEKYPEREEVFREHLKELTEEINGIAAKASRVLKNKTRKTFLIYHPALTYFAADYGLEQVSIEDEGKEPNPAHLKKIIDLAREKSIRIIFIQNQFDSNNAAAIAREIGGKIIPIDPLAENWTEEMNRMIDRLGEQL
ncbi:MAG: zinc ABC transporter substrate-binding protein [Odoribacter sp.]